MKHEWRYTGQVERLREPPMYEAHCAACDTRRYHFRWGEQGAEAFFEADFPCHPIAPKWHSYDGLGAIDSWD